MKPSIFKMPLRQQKPHKTMQQVALLVCVASLYACSGESGVSEQNSKAVIEGTVLASNVNLPLAKSTQVFVDTNKNFKLDANEVQVKAKPNTGTFKLEVAALSQEQINSSFLVARQISDSSETYLASPLSAYVAHQTDGSLKAQPAVVSPLTSMVAGEMIINGLSLQEAQSTVSTLTKNVDALANYAVQNQTQAQQIAKDIAQNWTSLSQSDVSISAKELFASNVKVNKSQLLEQTYNPNKTLTLASESQVSSTLIDVNSPNATTGYIVTYKKLAGINTSAAGAKMMSTSQVKVTAQKMASSYGASVKQTYSSAFSGFAMQIPNKNINKFLADAAKNPMVERIEKDVPVVLDAVTTQTPATWGLDRSDQKKLPLNNTYNYTGDGSGVTAYVVDSGINPTHQEFAGRINPGFTSILDGRGTTDCKGHGSHVAGIIGGTKYGVAKKIRITPIRIFDCNGSSSLSGIIAGLDWIVKNGKRPGVINLSLGASPSNTFDAAVTAAHNAGFVVVASAGNFAGVACNQSPARAHKVITVASSDIGDVKSYYSNYGQCVDLFAPGSYIQSAWFDSNKATNTISGTSMSAPHVAGVAALYLQMKPTATPDQINYALLNSATASLVGTIGKDTPNRLLNITNKLNFTPVEQPIYVPPIVSPLPPPSPVPGPKPPTPIKAFRKISIEKIQVSTSKPNKTTWKSQVVIQLYSPNKGPLDDALVNASFTPGGTNLVCTTDARGVCTISSGTLSMNKTSTNFSINQVSGENLEYSKVTNKVVSKTIKSPF